MTEDQKRLGHIADAIMKLLQYAGHGQEEFLRMEMLYDACLRQLAIIGEAVKHVSPEVRGRHADIPWREIAAARDVYIHAYFGLQPERVWKTITVEVPKLRAAVISEIGEG